MKSNSELQKDVQNAIRWEPSMQAAEIGVTAKNGVITLSGTVDSYAKKINAERAAKNVLGVKAIAEEITVNYGKSFTKNDTDIAKEVLESWKTNLSVPDKKVAVKVEDGWLTLEGEVEWYFQKETAGDALVNLPGVKGVNNRIAVNMNSKDTVEQKDVEQALERSWAINPLEIKVNVKNNNVKLTGLVHSIYQKEEAGRLAWNAPGVSKVENDLAVIY
jgi:osmotically-inducible protein OsmY